MNREQFEKVLHGDSEDSKLYQWAMNCEFRRLMDDAMFGKDADFAVKLQHLYTCVNAYVPENRLLALQGMVEAAKKDPATIRKMFLWLYADDKGNLELAESKMTEFVTICNGLLLRYCRHLPSAKQDVKAVSGYLFLYDPDKYYALYEGSQVKKMKAQEKKVQAERKNQAKECEEVYQSAASRGQVLREVLALCEEKLVPGATIYHKTAGEGTIVSYTDGRLEVKFADESIKKFGVAQAFQNRILRLEDEDVNLQIGFHADLLLNRKSIEAAEASAKASREELLEYL